MVLAGPGVLARGARARPRAGRAADQEAGVLDALGAEPRVQQVLRDARQGLRPENGLGGPGGHGALPGLRGEVPGRAAGQERGSRHLHGHDAPLVRPVRFLRSDAGRSRQGLGREPAEVHGGRRQVERRALRHPDRARELPADVHQRRSRAEGRRHDLPRVLVLRLGEEERAGRHVQGRSAPVREGVPRRGQPLPVDEPRLQEQPEQAGGLGVPALHQHREGRSRPAPGPGDPAGLDGESRVRLRQDTARLPVDAGHAEAARAAGLRLYPKVLDDPTFWQAVANTVSLLGLSVPTTVVLALAVALGLHRLASLRWRSVWTAMYFLPFSVSLVAAALIWQWMYDPIYGFLNHLLGQVGLPAQKWLQSLEQVRPSLALVNVWARLGFDTIIFLAALQAIPTDYYEAASIDGAGRSEEHTSELQSPMYL